MNLLCSVHFPCHVSLGTDSEECMWKETPAEQLALANHCCFNSWTPLIQVFECRLYCGGSHCMHNKQLVVRICCNSGVQAGLGTCSFFIKIEHFPFILVAYLVLKHQHHLKLTTWHAIHVFALLMMYRTNINKRRHHP